MKNDYQPAREKSSEGPSVRGESSRKFEPVRTPVKKASRLNASKIDKIKENEESGSPDRK